VNQCNQQGYHPKAMTMAAALLFPSGVEALGDLGEGMSSEVWWTPAFPFESSLTGQVSRDIADEWEEPRPAASGPSRWATATPSGKSPSTR
jgi:branched-chain amino acid transport system substrate-binding protein